MAITTIQTLFPVSIPFSKGKTDFHYLGDLKVLETRFPLLFRRYDNRTFVAKNYFLFFATGVLRRLPLLSQISRMSFWVECLRSVSIEESVLQEADLLFSNYWVPLRKPDIPFILEADFIPYGATIKICADVESRLRIPPRIIDMCDVIIVRTKASKEFFHKWYPTANAHVAIIPHYMPYIKPIDPDEMASKWDITGPVNILFVANATKLKGLVNLVEAAKGLRYSLGPNAFSLEVISNFHDGKVNIPRWVKVTRNAQRNDVVQRMREAHVFALPTLKEAFGKVFCEAIAAGCVLLTPDWYPMATEELWGNCGIAVDVTSVESIQEGLRRFITGIEGYADLGRKNRDLFLARYAPEKVGAQYNRLFSDSTRPALR